MLPEYQLGMQIGRLIEQNEHLSGQLHQVNARLADGDQIMRQLQADVAAIKTSAKPQLPAVEKLLKAIVLPVAIPLAAYWLTGSVELSKMLVGAVK